ncbi:MAG: transglycosylase domain-containing protein [Oscillospiraceae bacterium]
MKLKNKAGQNEEKGGSRALHIIGTTFVALILILIISFAVFATALTIYILNFADTTTTISLDSGSTGNISRFLYKNPDYDKNDKDSKQYELYYSLSNPNTLSEWVDIEDIPDYVVDAYVCTEDERFRDHDGVDFKRTIGSIIYTLLGNKQGGSTITQQTIKNITGDNSAIGTEGVERKIREIFRAINVEKTYTKEEILQAYMNIIPLGDGQQDIIGIQSAANYYFGKDVSDLTLAEAASLSGMTQEPANLNPHTNPKENKVRQKYSLTKMLENGAISDEEYDEAINQKLKVTADPDYRSREEYKGENANQGPTSYFIDAALNQATEIIAKKYGISEDQANQRLYNGGYTIYTTVDMKMQKQVEKNMQNPSNFQSYYFDNDPLLAGFIAMDYKGNVKAVVGGRDKKTESRTWSNATQATRSPGSCIKPIAAYAPALEQDIITWSSMYVDEPITIKKDGKNTKWPVNYSETGESANWSGQKLFTWQMLERSLNTMPAQLIKKMSVAYSYNFLKEKLDISTLTDKDMDWSPVTVGGMTNGTILQELVSAYSIFGNGGKKYDTTYITSIVDASGEKIYEHTDNYKQAISESTSYVMNRMMLKVVDDADGTGRQAKLNNTEVAAKTGTTTDWTNLTFVGCTPDYVSGVWVGYDKESRIATNQYQNIGAIWKNIFGDIAENEKNKDFGKMPSTVKQLNYCKKTGLIAGSNCWDTDVGYYKQTNVPEVCNGNHY